jgi:hypothetical protein
MRGRRNARRKFKYDTRQSPDVIPAEAKSVMVNTMKEAWALSSNLLDYPEESGLK